MGTGKEKHLISTRIKGKLIFTLLICLDNIDVNYMWYFVFPFPLLIPVLGLQPYCDIPFSVCS